MTWRTGNPLEKTKYWHVADYGDLELLHATYVTHSFSKHIHDGFAIGVIERGAERFLYRGGNPIAGGGKVVVINPGEIHTGQAQHEHGWTYRMFYPGVTLMRQIAHEMTGKRWDMPFFDSPVIHDREIALLLRNLHIALEHPVSRLTRDSWLRAAFGQFIARHAVNRPLETLRGGEHEAVRRAQHYLQDHYAENVTLDDLAAYVGLSPYHLLRVFREKVGLPPHQYQIHLRIQWAKALLSTGESIADVALMTGFTDQSHLTRRFKGIVGVPPGQYVGV